MAEYTTDVCEDEVDDTCSQRNKRPSITEELKKQQYAATEKCARIVQALTFLRANPQFDEFITLIRTGCIRI